MSSGSKRVHERETGVPEEHKKVRAEGGDTAAGGAGARAEADGDDELVFEDPYEDVYEDEEEDGDEDDDDGDGSGEEGVDGMDVEADALIGEGEVESEKPVTVGDVWRPDRDMMAEGEHLECDMTAYVMYHQLAVEWPCLSFDIVPDDKLGVRTSFPMSATVVAGTQADKASNNRLLVMRFGALHKTQKDGVADSDDESDDDGGDDDATVEVQRINHYGGVNRVRVMPQEPHVVASWSDTGKVNLFDIRPQLRLLDAAEGRGVAAPVPKGYGPAYTFAGHGESGHHTHITTNPCLRVGSVCVFMRP